MRHEQAQRECRLAKWGEQVAVALAERDAVVTDCEQRAGRALRSLIESERLSTRDALSWCGDDTLTGREVYRLIRGVPNEEGHADELTGDGENQGARDVRPDEPASVGPAEEVSG